MVDNKLLNNYFIGIVEDNEDPEKKQRIRVRIPFIHGKVDEIPTDSLPWCKPARDLDGKSYSVPDINKIVSVTFPTGNPYLPIYQESLHLDINLQNKLETYSGADLAHFKAFCFDYNTQIYKDNEKLNIIYNNSGMIVDAAGNVTTRLNDNSSKYFIGDENANQSLVLGNNFFNWMDQFMNALPNFYLGNNGAPCAPQPSLIEIMVKYQALKENFLSKNAFVSTNNAIKTFKEDIIVNNGDIYEITNKESIINVEKISENNEKVAQKANSQTQAKESAIAVNDNINDEIINQTLGVHDETKLEASEVQPELVPNVEETPNVYIPQQSNNSNSNSNGNGFDDDEVWYDYDELTGTSLNDNNHNFSDDDEQWYDYDELTVATEDYNADSYNLDIGSNGTTISNINYNTKKEPLDYSLIPNNMLSSCVKLNMALVTSKGTIEQNMPDNNDHLRNLKTVCERYFDAAYKFFKPLGYELKINSAYRSTYINDKVGGSKTSQHKTGSALDLILIKDGKRYNNLLFYFFKYKMKHFGQLIWEGDCQSSGHKDGDNGPQWVHISLNNNSKQGHIFCAAGGVFKKEHPNTIQVLKEGKIINDDIA